MSDYLHQSVSDSTDYIGVEPTLEVKYALAVAEVERLNEVVARCDREIAEYIDVVERLTEVLTVAAPWLGVRPDGPHSRGALEQVQNQVRAALAKEEA